MATDDLSKPNDSNGGKGYFRRFGPPIRSTEHHIYGQDRRFVVFYVWQSDTPSELNRMFIRRALDKAAVRINVDANRRFNIVWLIRKNLTHSSESTVPVGVLGVSPWIAAFVV